MRIGQDQILQCFDRKLFKVENGDLPIAELLDNIHTSPENLHNIQDDYSIAIMKSLRQFMEKVFPDINTNFYAPEQQLITWIAEMTIDHQRTAQLIR